MHFLAKTFLAICLVLLSPFFGDRSTGPRSIENGSTESRSTGKRSIGNPKLGQGQFGQRDNWVTKIRTEYG